MLFLFVLTRCDCAAVTTTAASIARVLRTTPWDDRSPSLLHRTVGLTFEMKAGRDPHAKQLRKILHARAPVRREAEFTALYLCNEAALCFAPAVVAEWMSSCARSAHAVAAARPTAAAGAGTG